MQLLDLVKQEKSGELAKYITLVIDEMYIKEGLFVWKAVEHLTRIGFKVLAIVCDGAKNNRRMFNLHSTGNDFCYKTHNVYSEDKHPIFFICDPPHLIKTTRNCFSRGKL